MPLFDATRASTGIAQRSSPKGRREPHATPERDARLRSYYLIEADKGVLSSTNILATSAQADESRRVAATWVREEKLGTALPNPPKVGGGEVFLQKTNGVPGLTALEDVR